MTDKIKVGIIGCGGISRIHINAYRTNRDAEVNAVVDVDVKKAKPLGEEYGLRWYTDIDNMLDSESIDAASVCSPPKTHYAIVSKLAKSKVHILCEKPLATNTKNAKEMIDIANKHGILLLVAMCHRFHGPVVRLKKAIDTGRIGKIVSYRNRFHWQHTLSKDAARLRGGILLDNGSHSIDIFRFLVGEILKVNAIFNKKARAIEDIRHCAITLEAVNSVLGIIELDGYSPGSKGREIIEVYGDKGSGVIDYMGQSFLNNISSNRKKGLDNKEDQYHNRFRSEIAHFIDCIKGKSNPLIGAVEGLKDLEVIEAVFKAGKEGRTVAVGE